MAKESIRRGDKKLLERIFRDTESIETAREIADVWNRRGPLASALIRDSIIDRITDDGYIQNVDGWGKPVGDFQVYLWDCSPKWGERFALGYLPFPLDNNISDVLKDKLRGIVQKTLPDKYFSPDKSPIGDKLFEAGTYLEKYGRPLDDDFMRQIVDDLFGWLKALEEAAKNVQG